MIGPIDFDRQLVERQLRNDLRDDWFTDPLRFEDMFTSNHIERDLTENLEKHHGEFSFKKRTLLDIPKPNFTLRYGLEVSLSERALYHAIAMHLGPLFDPLLPPCVFSHRACRDSKRRYLFKRGIPQWRDFNGSVHSALKAADKEFLLVTDLTNYFENIDLIILKKTLIDQLPFVDATAEQKFKIRLYIDVLSEYLTHWSFSKSSGLPQNRDASSFLSNIYMLPIDREMLKSKHRYFRYMDDIRIVCESEYAARKALKELSILLRQRGLSVNGGKTKIVSKRDQSEIDKCFEEDSKLQCIDSIWQTRSLKPIRRSLRQLRELTEQELTIGGGASRTFRFCIERLRMLASCPEFEVPDEYFQKITELAIEALSNHPASTDKISQYLCVAPTSKDQLDMIADLLVDNQKNFYSWQNYLLWLLLTWKEHEKSDLLAYAMDVVQNEKDDATRCGATLYAGALGGESGRIGVAKRFRTLSSFLGQRSAIIAVQELRYSPHIRDFVQPYVRSDLVGVYRSLKGRAPRYIAPPLKTPITSIVDSSRDYD